MQKYTKTYYKLHPKKPQFKQLTTTHAIILSLLIAITLILF